MKVILLLLTLILLTETKAQGVDGNQNEFISELLSSSDTLRITGNPKTPIFIDTLLLAEVFSFFKDSSLISQTHNWENVKDQIEYNNRITWSELDLGLKYPAIYSKKNKKAYANYHENYSLPIAISQNQCLLFRRWMTSEVFKRTIDITLWTKTDSSWKTDEYKFLTSSPVVSCSSCQLIDCYIDRVAERCGQMRHELCHDTINKRMTFAIIDVVSAEDNCIPVVYTVYQKVIQPKGHMYLILSAIDSTEKTSSLNVPTNCRQFLAERGQKNSPQLRACINEYAIKHNVKIDTIYDNTSYAYHNHKDLTWECSYYEELPNGFEKSYYSFSELNGVKIIENNQLLCYQGEWENGKKIGEWNFYQKNGVLMRTEYYKKGILKKTEANP